MQFLGHLNRHKGLEHLALTGKIEGKRGRGRQRVTYQVTRKKFVQMNANKIVTNYGTYTKVRRNVKHQSGCIVL